MKTITAPGRACDRLKRLPATELIQGAE